MEARRARLTDEQLGAAIRQMWDDQAAFNTLFRPVPATPEEVAAQTKEFVLYTEDELHELLRTFRWKAHRRLRDRGANPGHTDNELTDVLKCTLSLFQINGWTPEQLIEEYWRKTAVVRQRYAEEWQTKLDSPCAVIDIDNVLCDYTRGYCTWLLQQEESAGFRSGISDLMSSGDWMTAARAGMSEHLWQFLKHRFRVTGSKRDLPVFDDARDFLGSLRAAGLIIVLLTSRPIDRYPNIYTDTLLWLQQHELPFDFLWWSGDKLEGVLEAEALSYIRLIVDDDRRHLEPFAKLGKPLSELTCYWLRRDVRPIHEPNPRTLHEVWQDFNRAQNSFAFRLEAPQS